MDRLEEMRTLLCAPYAVKAEGTVLSADGRGNDWTGVKKVQGKLALRWDGRVLTDSWHTERTLAIAGWRQVKDISCCGHIEGALLDSGELTWIRANSGQVTYGSSQTDWTDVERLFITCDPYDKETSYADYAVGLRADGSARVAYMGGGEDRSGEIAELLNSVGGVNRISEDCRALAADGRVHDFSTRNMGRVSREPLPGFDWTEDGCVLQDNGTVQVPEGWYPGAEGWRSVLCISGCFLPIETGRHILMGLQKDGRILLAERYGNVPVDTSDWKLFDHPDTFLWEREKAETLCVNEGLALDFQEETDRRLKELRGLTRDKTYAEAALKDAREELTRVKGPFSKKKRVKLEGEIAVLEQRLDELNKRLSNI